jgi:DEAD_2
MLSCGVVQDLRQYGRKKQWCPYFLARHMLAFANIIVYNYQYMLDPKVRLPSAPLLELFKTFQSAVVQYSRRAVPTKRLPSAPKVVFI